MDAGVALVDSSGQNCPVRIIRNNKEFTNQSDIAEQCNQHFVNVGPNLAKAIPQSTNGDQCGLINHSPLLSFFNLSPVTGDVGCKFFLLLK